MLGVLGDIHRNMDSLRRAHDIAAAKNAAALIQVGDFGFDEYMVRHLARCQWSIPIYAIDGNHENFSVLRELMSGGVHPMGNNFFYVGRGTALTLDGRRIAFLGGAGSIDKHWRLQQGWLWQPDEQITDDDVRRTSELGPVDIMITHCPPQRTITKHFETPEGIRMKVNIFGVPPDWSDPSATQVEAAWASLGFPPLYCGHMHRSVVDDKVQILHCDELVFV